MTIYLGENLKSLRKARGITQEAFANYLGVSFQAVSKWERNDSYPDITMLPEIAEFFSVTLEDLLGVNREEKEREIKEQLFIYDNLPANKDERWNLISSLKDKFPNDYRVLLRYMSYHIHFEDKYKCNSLVQSIYENIINNCTDDDIRICAKRHIVQHYMNMAKDKESGITYHDIEKVLSSMPYMRDGKDFVTCYLYNEYHPKHYNYCKEALEEILGLLNIVINNSFVWDYSVVNSGINEEDNYIDYNIDLLKKMNSIFDMFYDDNYGRQWQNVLNNYLNIGYFYSLKKDYDNAIASFNKALELAKNLDAYEEVTVLKSKNLNGIKFDRKTDLGMSCSACTYIVNWIKERLNQFPKELSQRQDFKNLIQII